MARVYKSTSIDPSVTTNDLNAMSKMLATLGVSVETATGAYRPFNDIIADVATKEKGMTDSEKDAINTQGAGVRQANILQAALDTVSKSQGLLNDATNSSGDLQNAQNIYLGTAAAKWTQLGATMDTVFQNMVSSSAIKDTIGGLVDLASDLGNIQTILAIVGMAVGVFAGKWILSMVTAGLSAVGTAFDVGLLATASDVATVATINFNKALDANPIGVVMIAVMACVTAYDLLHKTVKDQIDVFTADTTKIQNEIKCVQDLTDSMSILNKVESEKDPSVADKQQLISTNNTLAQQYPQLISGYDAETKSFIIDKKALDDLIASKQKMAMQDNASMIASAQASQATANANIKNDQSQLNQGQDLNNLDTSNITSSYGLTDSKIKALNADIATNTSLLTASGNTINSGIQFIDDYIAKTQSDSNTTKENTDAKNKAEQQLINLGYTQATINTDLAKSTTSINGQTSAMSALSQETATFNTQEEALATTFKNAEQETEDLNSLTAKMHDGQKLSASDVADLIVKYPELAGAVKGSAGAYTIEQSAIDKLNKANIAGAQTTINTEISNTKATLDGLAPRLKAYGIEVDAINSVATAKENANKITKLAPNQDGPADPNSATNAITPDEQTMKDAINQYGALQDQASSLNKLLSDPTFGVTSSDTTSPTSTSPTSTTGTTATGTTAADKKLATAQTAVDDGTATAAQTKLVNASVASTNTTSSAQKTASDAIIAGYQAQINAINAKTAAEAKATQQLQAQNQLIQDQTNLETAQNEKNVKYINASGKWAWESNQATVQTAQAAVTADKTSQSQTNTANATQNALDSLNAKITAQQNKATLGGYASGTDYVPQTGSYIVGEKGQEEVVLPQGAQVIPNDQLSNNDSNGVSSDSTSNNSSTDTDSSNVNNTSTVKQSVTDLINSVNTSIETFVNNSPQFGKDTDNNIGQAIINNEELIKKPLDNLVSDLTNDIETFVNNSPEFAKDTENNIGQSITTNEALLTAPLDTLITKIQAGIATFVTGSYAYGTGTVTEMGKGMTDSTKNITDVVKTLTGKIVTQFQTSLGIASPSKVMQQIGEYMMQGLAKGVSSKDIVKFIETQYAGMGTAGAGALGAISDAMGGNITTELTTALKNTGTPMSWLPEMLRLVSHEDASGNPSIQNPTEVLGQHATGLLQMLPSTFSQHMVKGYGDIDNPIDNAMSSINYIKSEYGDPSHISGLNGGHYVGYANGSESISSNQIGMVGEQGAELHVLNQGDGVLPTNLVKNLMDWGKFNPNNILKNILPNFNIPNMSNFSSGSAGGNTSTDRSINIQNLSVVSNNADNLFAQLKSRANVLPV